jgi:hypothetical protein
MWTLGLNWDDSLNEKLVKKSKEWFRELGDNCIVFENLKISRHQLSI